MRVTWLRLAPAVIVAVLGALGLVAWIAGRPLLASAGARFIPMAPSTGIAFLLLAAAFLLLAAGRGSRAVLLLGAAVTALALSIFQTLLLGTRVLPDVEPLLVGNPGTFGAVPLGRMSPVTAAGLASGGLAVMLLGIRSARPWRGHAAGILGLATALVGVTVVLGYAYRTPLLYGGAVIPVALPTGVALTGAGIATLIAAGGTAWPVRAFVGGSARARLLRAFLPGTTLAFLAAGAAGHALIVRQQTNPALAAAAATLAATALVALIVTRLAGSVGRAIDEAEAASRRSRDELERRVAERTAELTRANQELEAFSYSVSHDLRAPLRHISGFAAMLQASTAARLEDKERRYVQTIVDAASRMSRLVDDLLSFSRMARAEMLHRSVSLDALVDEVVAEGMRTADGRQIDWKRQPLPVVRADREMLRLALSNLVSNALKYTAPRERAVIEIGTLPAANGESVLFVRDNGVGFDMAYSDKLFGVFQRLHRADEFEGTGIGLANVRRVIQRHGGRTWAESEPDRGATFYMSLPS